MEIIVLVVLSGVVLLAAFIALGVEDSRSSDIIDQQPPERIDIPMEVASWDDALPNRRSLRSPSA